MEEKIIVLHEECRSPPEDVLPSERPEETC